MTPRQKCYTEIKALMRDDITTFYKENPDKFGDERSQVAIDISLKGLGRILMILDKYEIGEKANA